MYGFTKTVLIHPQHRVKIVNATGSFNVRITFLNRACHRKWGNHVDEIFPFIFFMLPNPIQAISFGMKLIVAEFTPYKQHDKYARCYSHSQPQDIYQTVSLVRAEITNGDFKIIAKHVCVLMIVLLDTGYWRHAPRCMMQDAGCQIPSSFLTTDS